MKTPRPRVVRFLQLLLVLGVLLRVDASAFGQENGDLVKFFESRIRPILIEHCYKCHSVKAAREGRLEGDLQLDTREGTRRGGDTGPAVVPGKPEKSLLISALRHDGLEMPPEKKLPARVVDDFVRWVRLGAIDPRDGKRLEGDKLID